MEMMALASWGQTPQAPMTTRSFPSQAWETGSLHQRPRWGGRLSPRDKYPNKPSVRSLEDIDPKGRRKKA